MKKINKNIHFLTTWNQVISPMNACRLNQSIKCKYIFSSNYSIKKNPTLVWYQSNILPTY